MNDYLLIGFTVVLLCNLIFMRRLFSRMDAIARNVSIIKLEVHIIKKTLQMESAVKLEAVEGKDLEIKINVDTSEFEEKINKVMDQLKGLSAERIDTLDKINPWQGAESEEVKADLITDYKPGGVQTQNIIKNESY